MKHSLEELTLTSSMGRNKSSVVIKAYDEEWRRAWRHFYSTQVVLSTLSPHLPGSGDWSSIGDRCDQQDIDQGLRHHRRWAEVYETGYFTVDIFGRGTTLVVTGTIPPSWFLWLCVSCHVGENILNIYIGNNISSCLCLTCLSCAREVSVVWRLVFCLYSLKYH